MSRFGPNLAASRALTATASLAGAGALRNREDALALADIGVKEDFPRGWWRGAAEKREWGCMSMQGQADTTATSSSSNLITDLISIARPDHWFKNVFMVPGFLLAIALTQYFDMSVVVTAVIGLISTCLVASANYTINEYLDAEFDRFHPLKKSRPGAAGRLDGKLVLIQYIVLSAVGLGLGFYVNMQFGILSAVLLFMGVMYNVKPFRTKDRMYLDVLSEAINNPLRLLLGWSILVPDQIPPSSIIIAYWMGGAYLMAVKRYAEYRLINDPERAGLYRRSFKFYDEKKLLVSSFFYAINAAFFLAIFLYKYRAEFLLTFPLFALLFSWYLWIGSAERSTAQTPEKLYKQKLFMVFVTFLGLVCGALFLIDIPQIEQLLENTPTFTRG